jgi:phosphoribosylanthranilate isomerase
MVWIKICGITDVEDANKIAELGCDTIGLVFAKASPRKVDYEDAIQIIDSLKDKLKESNGSFGIDSGQHKVQKQKIRNNKKLSVAGVFVNEDIDEIVAKTIKLGLDFVQFSGDENKKYLDDFRKKLDKSLRTISFKNADYKNSFADLEKNTGNKLKYRGIIKSIRVGFDGKSAGDEVIKKILEFGISADYFLLDKYSDKSYGGTGNSFDWKSVENLGNSFPVILAGGLDCENIVEAVRMVNPFGVDASSKLEIRPGKKDMEKVKDFIENAKIL